MGDILTKMRSQVNYFRYKGKIVKIVDEARGVKSFYLNLNADLKVYPGQFMMVWLPEYEEIPISISLKHKDIIRLTISAVGETTNAIHRLSIGDHLILRGPYGRPFQLKKNIILVGGGYGVAPLIFALNIISEKAGSRVFIIGARSKDDLLFVDEARELGAEVIIATEDGSLGTKGLVTDLLSNISYKRYDSMLICGPEMMMKKIFDYIKSNNIDIDAQFSLERYIKCGIGLCGSCVLDRYRVCVDGPVFTLKELEDTSFGLYKRDECGRIVKI